MELSRDVVADDIEVVAVVEDVGLHWGYDSVSAHVFATTVWRCVRRGAAHGWRYYAP